MGRNYSQVDRRKLLSVAAASAAGAFVPAAATAQPDKAQGKARGQNPSRRGPPSHSSAFELHGDKVRFNEDHPHKRSAELAATAAASRPSDGEPIRGSPEKAAEQFNEAIDNGTLEVVGENENGVLVNISGSRGGD